MPNPNPYERLYMFADNNALRGPSDQKVPDINTKKPEALESYERLLRELEKRPIEEPKRPAAA